MSGDQVWGQYLAGDLTAIRDYCETDVLNTYLIYLRFQLIRGIVSKTQLEAEVERVRDKLEQSDSAHLKEYLRAWKKTSHGG